MYLIRDTYPMEPTMNNVMQRSPLALDSSCSATPYHNGTVHAHGCCR
jgi:hypothetical protein